jgi:proton glutamate symport protein
MSKKSIRIIVLISLTLILIVHLLNYYHFTQFSKEVLLILRVLVCLVLLVYAFRRKKLTTWILVSMWIGAELGHDLPGIAMHLRIIGQVFLKLVKCIIAPLLFATLAYGIAGHSNLNQVGRIAWKSILYFEVVTTIALFIGIIAINITKPGEHIGNFNSLTPHEKIVVPSQTWEDVVLHIFPDNIAKAVAEGQILQIVIFSILFGIGLALVKETQKAPMLGFLESLSETMFKFTNVVMYAAPFAVGASIAYTVSQQGIGILVNLLNLLGTLYGALIALIILVFVPVAMICRISIKKFAKAISEPVSLAFATTSSEAALPKAMEAMEKFGVPRKIIAFVMPMGYSFNLDGTTLYLSLASVFVAQAAGIEMSIEKQLLMVFTLMLTSKGVAGVPRASLVILLGTATSFGLPLEPIFIILGIDELMDMARTSVNVTGNCLATVVVAKWEGEFKKNTDKETTETAIS